MSHGSSDKTREEVLRVLAADLACDVEALTGGETVVVESRQMDGRRRFPYSSDGLCIVTTGRGVVISCPAEHMDWFMDNLGHLERDSVFAASTIALVNDYLEDEGRYLAGPDLKFVCDDSTFMPADINLDVNLRLVREREIPELYRYTQFTNALSYEEDGMRPDILVCVAEDNGDVVGMAGASIDSENLWQVGVDVLHGYRRRGIGTALVSCVTEAVLDEGKIPYYSTYLGNLGSQRLAVGLGYQPEWLELYVR